MNKIKLNVNSFRKMKREKQKIVMLTAYDALTAKFAEMANVDIILVGDSMANTALGYQNTIFLSLEESLFHTAAVRRGAPNTFIVGDMPFMTFQNSVEKALDNAAMYLQKAGANAVKIEGDESIIPLIKRMVDCGIPVMGHIGLLPQKLLTSGTYKIAGKTQEDATRLIKVAKEIEEAGAFAVVLECMPAKIAKEISEAISIPTIGIGGGISCDGQVQVLTDLLGVGDFLPKHAKAYANLKDNIATAIKTYEQDVRNGKFPTDENSF